MAFSFHDFFFKRLKEGRAYEKKTNFPDFKNLRIPGLFLNSTEIGYLKLLRCCGVIQNHAPREEDPAKVGVREAQV